MLTIIRLGVRLLIGGKLILRLLPKTGRPICISIGGSGGDLLGRISWLVSAIPGVSTPLLLIGN